MGRILSIDFGERRIGLALSDETRTIAQPLATLVGASQAQAVEQIAALVREHDVDLILVGHPTDMRGQETQRSRQVQVFRAAVEQRTGTQVALVDERFSTALARRYLTQGFARVRPDRQPVDKVAAVILLEDYLSRVQQDRLKEQGAADRRGSPDANQTSGSDQR